MSSLVEIKAQARRSIHGRAAVPAFLFPTDKTVTIETRRDLTVRWHNKLDTTGSLDGNYGTVIEGVDRLVFLQSELDAPPDDGQPIVLSRNNLIIIPGYGNAAFSLDAREPTDGPEEVAWTVARLKATVPPGGEPPALGPYEWQEIDW